MTGVQTCALPISGYSRDYGNYIIIGKERNNWSAMYAIYGHLKERTDEATGDFMYAGMYIGPMGSTGRSTGPHLHFEIRVAGEKVNPRSFIQF